MSKGLCNAVITKLLETITPGAIAEEKLAALLSEERYAHSVGTAEEAARLAANFDADADKAYTAGLLHDCAKDLYCEDARAVPFPSGLEPDERELSGSALIHGPAGAALAAELFAVTDAEVLGAVRFHVTGCPAPTSVDFAVWLADCVEPSRKYPGVGRLRDLSEIDPDAAVITWMLAKAEFARCRGFEPHPRLGEMLASLPDRLVAVGRRYFKEILPEINEAD